MFGKFIKRKCFFKKYAKDLFAIAAGILVFSAATLATITRSSIWFDEAFSAYMIRFNWFDIAKYTANDVHPPLYYWLLSAWTSLFGTTELTIRTMSVFFGCIALVFGYLIIKKLFNRKVAELSLLFMALSPMLIRYGQEARMYTLVVAIAMAATYVLLIALESKKKLPWVIYGILVSLGMWAHYFTALIWLAHWLWRAFEIRKEYPKKKRLRAFFSKGWVLAYIVAVGLYLPWLPSLVHQIIVVQAFGFWIPAVTPNTLVNFLTNFVYYQDADKVNGWMSVGIIFAVAIISFLSVKAYTSMKTSERKSFRFIIFLAIAPIVILFFASMPPLRSSFIDRYLIPSCLGLSMIIAVAISYSGKLSLKQKKLITSAFTIAFIVGICNVYYWGNFNKNTNHWNGTREIIKLVKSKSTNDEPIIINSSYLFYEAIFYADKNHPVLLIDPEKYEYGSTDMIEYNDQFKIKKVNGSIDYFTKKHSTFWYVGYSSEDELTAPYSNWQPIQEAAIKDKFSGEHAYKAIEYKVE